MRNLKLSHIFQFFLKIDSLSFIGVHTSGDLIFMLDVKIGSPKDVNNTHLSKSVSSHERSIFSICIVLIAVMPIISLMNRNSSMFLKFPIDRVSTVLLRASEMYGTTSSFLFLTGIMRLTIWKYFFKRTEIWVGIDIFCKLTPPWTFFVVILFLKSYRRSCRGNESFGSRIFTLKLVLSGWKTKFATQRCCILTSNIFKRIIDCIRGMFDLAVRNLSTAALQALLTCDNYL